jgi:hypothetical protein
MPRNWIRTCPYPAATPQSLPASYGAIAVVGDWNGDGRTKVGYFYQGKWLLDTNGNGQFDPGIDRYSTAFPYTPADKPVTGDWTCDGIAKIDLNGNGLWDGVGPGQDRFNGFGGTPGNQPLIGRW